MCEDVKNVLAVGYSRPGATEALDSALASQAQFNKWVQNERFKANNLRIDANTIDAKVFAALEEYNEIMPVPPDYEPIMPIRPPTKEKAH